jgi:hypothetical protein
VVAGVEEDDVHAGDGAGGEVREQAVGHRGGDGEPVAEGLPGPAEHRESLLDRVGDALEAGVGLGGPLRRRADGGRHAPVTPVPVRRTVNVRRQAAQCHSSADSP